MKAIFGGAGYLNKLFALALTSGRHLQAERKRAIKALERLGYTVTVERAA
jgi:hypothetical protein